MKLGPLWIKFLRKHKEIKGDMSLAQFWLNEFWEASGKSKVIMALMTKQNDIKQKPLWAIRKEIEKLKEKRAKLKKPKVWQPPI